MSLYIQPYPFRRLARRLAQHTQADNHSLGVNIREEDDAYQLTSFVSGLQAEDLDIQVLENVVSIAGEYKADENEYLLNELPQGQFQRTLRMPSEIDAEKVEAKIVNGMLTLTLPKAESARPKKIKVSVN